MFEINFEIYSTGAAACISDSLLTGLQFVEGFESYFFVSRWTMHQLVITQLNNLALYELGYLITCQVD